MRMCSPHNQTPVGGRLSEFVEGWKPITNNPNVLSIVTKGYRLRFTSPPILRKTRWEIRSPQGPEEIQGMQEQISLMLQKKAITKVPPDSPGILIQRIPGKQSFWRVASSNRFIKSQRSHLRTLFLYVHYKLSSEYHQKRQLHIQNRPAGCVLSRTNTYEQQEVSQIFLQKQGLSIPSTPLLSKYSPQVFTRLGHTMTGYLQCLGISIIPCLADWLVHHPDHQVLLYHQSQHVP